MFTAGLLISASSAYLMPEQNTGSIIYADTRILDPRYARSAEDLVCAREQHSEVKFFPHNNGGGKGGGKVREMEHDQMIPIGCCPAGDPNGKPYGAGKGCCCGTVFNDDGNNFCCESDCQVYSNTLSGITKCNLAMGDVDYPWDSHGTMPPTIPPYTTMEPQQYDIDYELACPSAFYIPSPMTAACSDANNEGSFCSFSCPGQLKVRLLLLEHRTDYNMILRFEFQMIQTEFAKMVNGEEIFQLVARKTVVQMISELISISFSTLQVQLKIKTSNTFENTSSVLSPLCQLDKTKLELELLHTMLT